MDQIWKPSPPPSRKFFKHSYFDPSSYTVLQTQDSKFESWRSEVEHATSRSRRLPTILSFHPRVKLSIVGSLRDREVACSASDRQGSNFESCVWRTVSSHSSHHPQEVLMAQFSLYVHKGGLKTDSFHFISLSYMYDMMSIQYLLVCTQNIETTLGHQICVPPWILSAQFIFNNCMLYIFFQFQVFIPRTKH